MWMRYSRLTAHRLWIAGGLAFAILASAILVVSVNDKAQRLGRWLPRVTIDRKARKITLGISLTPSYEGVDLPKAKPMIDDLKFIAVPPKLPETDAASK
jgi:hypothetical protein